MITTTSKVLSWAGNVQNTTAISGKTVVFTNTANLDQVTKKVESCNLQIQIDGAYAGSVTKNETGLTFSPQQIGKDYADELYAAYKEAIVEIEGEF